MGLVPTSSWTKLGPVSVMCYLANLIENMLENDTVLGITHYLIYYL